jgi:transposase, IS605 orfB family
MYGTIKQKIKHLSKEDYKNLRYLCRVSKNLVNETIYNIRNHYDIFKEFLPYNRNYHMLKHSENYKILNSTTAQQIILNVYESFKNYFVQLKIIKQGDKWVRKASLPRYLDKKGFYPLIINDICIISGKLMIPYSHKFSKGYSRIFINIPPILENKIIKEVRIIPKSKARFFEIQYIYEKEVKEKDYKIKNILAIDLGVNNLCTCVTNTGKSFIIDGRRLKSINQWYNKESARLKSIKDKQKIKGYTLRLDRLVYNYKNRVNDYMNKAIRYIINYCKNNNVSVLIIGHNKDFQRNCNIGRSNNQVLSQLPLSKLIFKLEYTCKVEGIDTLVINEAYTSKASFFDKDPLPNYGDTNISKFSGKRVKRGLYRTANGYEFNADVNGALNILRKSNVVSLEALYARGEVDTPIRIRIK